MPVTDGYNGETDVHDAKQTVHAFIEATRSELQELLTEYIQHRSIDPDRALAEVEPGGTSECQSWLRDRLEALGTFASVSTVPAGPDQFSVVATLPASDPSAHRSVTFAGHSDVVPVTADQYRQWRGGDPWSGHFADGYVYGRGAVDMKGGNVAAIWAAHCLAQSGVSLAGRCSLGFTVGEESGNKEIGPLPLLEAGYGADILVIPEPSGLDICPATVGWLFFRIQVLGQAAHAAARGRSIYPSAQGAVGVNAIDVMSRILHRLRDLERQWGLREQYPGMEPGIMTINPVHVDGGSLQATTPDRCTAEFTLVVSPSCPVERAVSEIREAVASVAIGDPWLTAHPPQVIVPVVQDLFEPVTPPRDPISVELLLRARNDIGRGRLAVFGTPSDANFFAAAGQPSIVCGPGRLDADAAHGLDERVRMDDVVEAAKVYSAFILDWCNLPARAAIAA